MPMLKYLYVVLLYTGTILFPDILLATDQFCNWQKFDQDVPKPIIVIDQDSDSDATIVQVSFGDRLGALLDTVNEYANSIL